MLLALSLFGPAGAVELNIAAVSIKNFKWRDPLGVSGVNLVILHSKQVHFDGTKNEEAVLIIVGEGPATNTLVEEAKRSLHGLSNGLRR